MRRCPPDRLVFYIVLAIAALLFLLTAKPVQEGVNGAFQAFWNWLLSLLGGEVKPW